MLHRCILLFSLAAGFFGCEAKRFTASGPYDPQAVRYYADMLILREELRLQGSDSVNTRIKNDSLCRSYGYTAGQAENIIGSYRSDIHTWKGFNELVIHRLDSLQRMEQSKQGR